MNRSHFVALIAVAIIIVGWIAVRAWLRKQPNLSQHDAAEEMKLRAQRAVEEARDSFDVDLDFSPDSVKGVEAILAKLHDQHTAVPMDHARLVKESLKWGGYIGEVIRRDQPSHWELDSNVAGKGSLPIVFEREQRDECFPVGWCYKRIASGPEDNVWHKFVYSTSRTK